MENYDYRTMFPYMKYWITEDKIKEKFDSIKNNIPSYSTDEYSLLSFRPKTKLIDGKFGKKYIKIITPDDAYQKVNMIVDYFTEESRMKCSYKDYIDAYTYWIVFKDKIARELRRKNMDISPYNVREYIYQNHYECNAFKITTAAFVYHFFNATHILDFSAGWGDRLIAAAALNIKYFGIDPNIDNLNGYRKIIEFTGNHDYHHVEISGAEYIPMKELEQWTNKHGKFDLIFTSPPYFDYEIYSRELQSINTFVQYQYWLVYFLFAVIIRFLPFLETNGILGLYVQDTESAIICEPLVMFIETFTSDMKFIGVISEKYPMFFFRKGANKPMDYKIKRLFRENYGLIYKFSEKLVKNRLIELYEIETIKREYILPPYVKNEERIIEIVNDHQYNNVFTRSIFKLLLQRPEKTVITYGSRMGTMIYYLARVCYYLDKECYYYIPKKEIDFNIINAQKNQEKIKFFDKILDAENKYGLRIIEIDTKSKDIEYHKQLNHIDKIITRDTDTFVIPYNNFTDNIRQIFYETINQTISTLKIANDYKGTIFLVVNTTILIEALYKIFRNAKFYVVQINDLDYSRIYEMCRTKVVMSEYLFSMSPENDELPPSDITYLSHIDGKIWKHLLKHAKNGDICWMSPIS